VVSFPPLAEMADITSQVEVVTIHQVMRLNGAASQQKGRQAAPAVALNGLGRTPPCRRESRFPSFLRDQHRLQMWRGQDRFDVPDD